MRFEVKADGGRLGRNRSLMWRMTEARGRCALYRLSVGNRCALQQLTAAMPMTAD